MGRLRTKVHRQIPSVFSQNKVARRATETPSFTPSSAPLSPGYGHDFRRIAIQPESPSGAWEGRSVTEAPAETTAHPQTVPTPARSSKQTRRPGFQLAHIPLYAPGAPPPLTLPIQTKLMLGQTADPYEMARQVVASGPVSLASQPDIRPAAQSPGVSRLADSQPLLQRKFEDGTYANTAARGYVKIVKKAAGGEYLLLEDLTSRKRSIIQKGSTEYAHLTRSPGMSGYNITDAKGTIFNIQTFGEIGSQIFTLEDDLQDTPHLTWAMKQANEDVVKAKAIVEFLTPLLDGPVLELAKSQVQDTQNDVPLAKKRTTFLADYIAASKEIFDLATTQLRDAKDDVPLAKKRTDFLAPYIGQDRETFDLAKAQLQEAKDDVTLAGKQIKYLLSHKGSGKETFDIAKRELKRANGDPDAAQVKMGSLKGLFQWAGEAAEKEGGQYFESESEKARKAEEQSKKEAFEKSGLSKTALGKPKKLKGNKKYETYKTDVQSAEETREQAIKTAEVEQEKVKTTASEQNVKFVGETTKGALDARTVESLMQMTGYDQKAVLALQGMMEAQADPNSLGLAKTALGKGKGPVIEIAATCQSLLALKAPEENAMMAALFCSECNNLAAQSWVQGKAKTETNGVLQDHIYYLTTNIKNVAKAVIVLQTCGVNNVIHELNPLLDQEATQVQWLLTHLGTPYFSPLIYNLVSRKEKIKAMQDLVIYNVGHQNYGIVNLVNWIGSNGVARIYQVLQETTYEVNPKYVDLYMGWGGTASSPVQFLYLVRLQAALETAAVALTVYQADVNYAGSKDPPSRTGFIEYTFANGDRAEIHTHWNQSKKQLVSMHIQDASGANGVEINKWPYFKKVQEAVRDAHNNAVGGLVPTTNPINGKLTL